MAGTHHRAEVTDRRQARPPPLDLDRTLAYRLYPELEVWRPILRSLNVPLDRAVRVASAAKLNDTDFLAELLASGDVDEDRIYQALARDLGLGFVAEIDPDRLILRAAQGLTLLRAGPGRLPVKVENGEGRTTYLLAPEGVALSEMRRQLARKPDLRRRMALTTPRRLRAALLKRSEHLQIDAARNGLAERWPTLSARYVGSGAQGILIGAAAALAGLLLISFPWETLTAVHVASSMLFLMCVWLRFAAAGRDKPPNSQSPWQMSTAELPRYSVLVALLREAEVVPQLIDNLAALDWPRSKLDVKLICEADDRETIAAILRHGLPSHMELVEVPAGEPRTKPRALNHALPLGQGEIVVLYDAEDRPHPGQLREAWHRFSTAGPDLACLQAPLEVSNPQAGWIARQFAFEYAALFRGLLPFLARLKVVLPLGGTSNHFRRSVLEEVGAWDPYNVTEDADLGVRLARLGYRSETLTLPTYEDGPTERSVWVPQRTRWFKGWLMTWLVHMRSPGSLLLDLGLSSWVVMQILCVGLVASALVHPLMLAVAAVLAVAMAQGLQLSTWHSALLAIDVVNILAGYLSFLLLGWHTLGPAERRRFPAIVATMPLYWLMLSHAAWRAVLQLCRQPYRWEKTPHRRSMATPPESAASRSLASPMQPDAP